MQRAEGSGGVLRVGRGKREGKGLTLVGVKVIPVGRRG